MQSQVTKALSSLLYKGFEDLSEGLTLLNAYIVLSLEMTFADKVWEDRGLGLYRKS